MTGAGRVDPAAGAEAQRRAQVIGLGLVGASIGSGLRARGWHVSGVEQNEKRAAQARELGMIDRVGHDPAAELAFVATPASAVVGVVTELSQDYGETMVLTDVAGVKGAIAAAIDNPRFVAGHPMAGSEQEGPEGADPELFVGATWVLTPSDRTDPGAFGLVRSVVSLLGADVVALSAERHDELVALVSHVPHLTAATLMSLAGESPLDHAALMRLAAGGFRDMTRIAAGTPTIWPDICRDNAGAIVPALDRLIERLAEVRRMVAATDRAGLERFLEEARVARRNLPPRGLQPAEVSELRGTGAGPSRRAGGGDDGGRRARGEHLRPRDRPLGRRPAGRPRARDRRRGQRCRQRRPPSAWVPGGLGRARRQGGVTTAEQRVVAIDGPAGSGKSTVARAVAERLGLARLDTGAMYRAVTLLALRRGVDLSDEEAAADLAQQMDLRLGEGGGPGGGDDVMLGSEDVSVAIRSPEVDAAVSAVAALPAVRRVLVEQQREWVAEHKGGVVEGRDIGSVVFPDALLKVYLTASADERARRRMEQADADAAAADVDEAVSGRLRRRDHLDSTRSASPLVVPEGAVVVDSTGRTVDDVVGEVLSHLGSSGTDDHG